MKADKPHKPVGREESGGQGKSRSYTQVSARLPAQTSTLKSRRSSALRRAAGGSGQLKGEMRGG